MTEQPTAGHPRGLGDTLADLENLVRRYVVLPWPAVVAVVLWVAHAHTVEAFDATPYLTITSPEKRCGKTRLLEVLEGLVPRPWRVVRPTEAVLFRKIERDQATLLLDEVDAIFHDRGDGTEGLRALLNAGNRRGAVVSRCQGKDQKLVDFKVFCPKVLAGIGALPETVADRSIPIRLARRRAEERVGRFRLRDYEAEAAPLKAALGVWAEQAKTALAGSRADVPDVLHDRAAEAWEPLLAVADLAGVDWPARARGAAIALSGEAGRDDSVGVVLLRALREIFTGHGADRLLTIDLLRALVEREGEPWGAWWGAALDKNDTRGPGFRLAKLLKPYGIVSKTVRVGEERGKGYELQDFAETFSRYANDVTTRQPAPDAGFRANGRSDGPARVTSSNDAQSLEGHPLSRCHVPEPRGMEGADKLPFVPTANELYAVARRRGFLAVKLRGGVTVPAEEAAWRTLAKSGTDEDRAAAWTALRGAPDGADAVSAESSCHDAQGADGHHKR